VYLLLVTNRHRPKRQLIRTRTGWALTCWAMESTRATLLYNYWAASEMGGDGKGARVGEIGQLCNTISRQWTMVQMAAARKAT
jgi:hypothetical protein